MARATAVFTDVDLFQVAIKPAPPPPGPTVHVGLQTDPILACDTGTTTTRRSDAGTSTTADAASQRSSGSSVSAGTSTSEDGKDGGDGEGKGGDGDDGGDSASARRLAAAHMPGAAAMLRRSAGAMEAEVLANLRSVALRGYPPEPVGSSLLGGGAEGFAGLLTTGGVGGDGGAGGSVGPGGCKHHCTLRCGGVGSASATAGLEVTGLDWNAPGTVVVAALGRKDLGGWCELPGALAAWPIFRRQGAAATLSPSSASGGEGEGGGTGGGAWMEPEVVVEHSSCLVSVACHPAHPSLAAAGSYNGEVLLFDLSIATSPGAAASAAASAGSGGGGSGGDGSSGGGGGGNPLVFSSRIDDCFHREPVRRVAWVWDGDCGDYSLASVSADGKVLFWQLRHGLAFPSRGAALSLRRPITAVDASAVNASASGEGRKGLRGLQVTAVAGAVHGGTCVAFTGGGRGSGVGGGGGGGGGAAAALATAVMVVGSEAGAVLSFPPPAPLAAVPTTSSPEGPRWDTDARRILGAVASPDARAAVRSHVERWHVANFRSGHAIDAATVFAAKPDPGALFNGLSLSSLSTASPSAAASPGRFEPHAGPVLGLAASPFHDRLFASSGADGQLRLCSTLQARPLARLEASPDSGCLHDVSWSRSRPLVLAAAAASGAVAVFDLGHSSTMPVALLSGPTGTAAATASSSATAREGGGGGGFVGRAFSKPAVHAVSFNPRMRAFLAFGDSSGAVFVARLPPTLSEPRTSGSGGVDGESRALQRLVASLAEDAGNEDDGDEGGEWGDGKEP